VFSMFSMCYSCDIMRFKLNYNLKLVRVSNLLNFKI